MSDALRGRVAQADELRQVPTENIKALGEAGLFRVFQPKCFGGPELSMADVLPMITQTAQACPSSSWVMAVLQIHQWILGLAPEQTQEEVWADDPETLLCGVLQPRAMAKRVDGGYELGEAVWPYASGCDFASWAHLGGLVQNDNGPPDATIFLLPASDFEIIDDWHVVGLRGTGSKSLSAQETFVPDHRAFKLTDAIAGKLGEGRSTLYQSALMPMLCLNITGTALGVARTTIKTFIAHIENRNLPFSMDKQVDSPQTHELLADVMLMVDSAELLLDKGGAMVRDYAEAQEQMPVFERSQVRVYSSAAVKQCVTAIDAMFAASGGTALQDSNPLYKLSIEARAVAAHAALAHENNLQLWGAARLGKPLNSPMI